MHRFVNIRGHRRNGSLQDVLQGFPVPSWFKAPSAEPNNEKGTEDPHTSGKGSRLRTTLYFIVTFVFGVVLLVLGYALGAHSRDPRLSSPSGERDPSHPLPSDLPFVPLSQLVNATELDLLTGYFPRPASSAAPTIRTYELNVTLGLAAPDGFARPMLLANGRSPGPLIEADEGDTVRVRVNNLLPDGVATSIHWHGIAQAGTPWMDGVHGVSQCGIPAGEGFTYEFVVAGQRGTFWWHAHSGVQYSDGLFGPIVIHDKTEMVPDVDDDKIVFVGDTYHTYGPVILDSYLNSTSRWSPDESGVEPLPDNILINGQGTYDCSITSSTYPPLPDRPESSCTGGGLYTTTVSPGRRVRLRLINHSAFFSYWFSVDNHTLQIVEMDGVEVAPMPARGVYLNIGQRYSVVLVADRPAGNYLMRATLPRSCFLPYSTYTSAGLDAVGYQGKGLLSYEGTDPAATPIGVEGDTTNPYGVANNPALEPDADVVREGCDDMPFDAAAPMRAVAAYDVAAAAAGGGNEQYVEFAFRQSQDVNRIFVNKTSYRRLADNATLWMALDQDFGAGAANAYRSWGFGLDQQVLLFPGGGGGGDGDGDGDDDREKVVGAQLVINSGDDMEHPWHLHGHTFQVVGWGAGAFGRGTTTWADGANPMRRDTVTVPGNGHVVLRFLTNNPGMWALHCHVAWHVEGGMFVTIAERPEDLKKLVAGMVPETRRVSQGFCGR